MIQSLILGSAAQTLDSIIHTARTGCHALRPAGLGIHIINVYYIHPIPQNSTHLYNVTAHMYTHIYSLSGIVASGAVVMFVIAILVFLFLACCCPCCRYALRVDLKKPGFNKLVWVDKKQLKSEMVDLEQHGSVTK